MQVPIQKQWWSNRPTHLAARGARAVVRAAGAGWRPAASAGRSLAPATLPAVPGAQRLRPVAAPTVPLGFGAERLRLAHVVTAGQLPPLLLAPQRIIDVKVLPPVQKDPELLLHCVQNSVRSLGFRSCYQCARQVNSENALQREGDSVAEGHGRVLQQRERGGSRRTGVPGHHGLDPKLASLPHVVQVAWV